MSVSTNRVRLTPFKHIHIQLEEKGRSYQIHVDVYEYIKSLEKQLERVNDRTNNKDKME